MWKLISSGEEFFDGVSAREHRQAARKTIAYLSIFT